MMIISINMQLIKREKLISSTSPWGWTLMKFWHGMGPSWTHAKWSCSLIKIQLQEDDDNCCSSSSFSIKSQVITIIFSQGKEKATGFSSCPQSAYSRLYSWWLLKYLLRVNMIIIFQNDDDWIKITEWSSSSWWSLQHDIHLVPVSIMPWRFWLMEIVSLFSPNIQNYQSWCPEHIHIHIWFPFWLIFRAFMSHGFFLSCYSCSLNIWHDDQRRTICFPKTATDKRSYNRGDPTARSHPTRDQPTGAHGIRTITWKRRSDLDRGEDSWLGTSCSSSSSPWSLSEVGSARSPGSGHSLTQ